MKNTKYMQRAEFKERQGAFEFFCREAFEFVVDFAKSCKAGWSKLWAKKPSQQEQMAIDYSTEIVFWATWKKAKNRELFA